MSVKTSLLTITLHRDGISSPWGFRMSGGCDLDSPLVVTKVSFGSPSEGGLHIGDIIRKIGEYDARDLRHVDALNLFQNAGGSINLVIQRDAPVNNTNCNSRSSCAPSSTFQPPVAGGVATPFTVAGLPTYERSQQSPVNNLNRFPPSLIESDDYDRMSAVSPHRLEIEQETQALFDQPYRTNPLVLPGAKINKDPPQAVSYLRHHPNPMMRASPSHWEFVPEEIMRKQKVVPKQYNSPIGLYSEPNIVNSVNSQTGFTPFRKTVHYDPSKSETYRALHDTEYQGDNNAHEVNIPITRVFSPVNKPTAKKLQPPNSHVYNPNRASPQPHPTAPHPNV